MIDVGNHGHIANVERLGHGLSHGLRVRCLCMANDDRGNRCGLSSEEVIDRIECHVRMSIDGERMKGKQSLVWILYSEPPRRIAKDKLLRSNRYCEMTLLSCHWEITL